MMEGLPRTAVGPDPDKIFRTIPQPGVLKRLVRALADTAGELSAGASSYFGVALLPDRLEEWFPLKLSKLIGASLAHPVATIEGAFASDDTRFTRRKWFVPVLAASAAIHGVAIIYLIYLAFFSPYANIRVVNKAFPKFDRNALDEKLYYPPQVLLLARGPAMTLEEIRARAEKRKEELARAKEKAEKERKNKEEAERKAAEDAAKAAAEKKPVPTEFGEINEAPIKATVETLYQLFQAGGLDIPEMKFSVMAGFKVETDGSLSNIHIIQPSKSPIINEKAKEILHNISYSHALGPVSDLSSATISLDVTEDLARLRIMAFATTPETAKAKADLLKVLFWALRMKQKSPDVAELLSLIKVKSEGKRVDTDLIVPREKAAEMFRAWVAHPSTPPQ